MHGGSVWYTTAEGDWSMQIRRVLWLVALGLMAGRLTTEIPHIKAQSGCSVQTLSAAYSYALSGTYFDNLGNRYGYTAVGRLVPDGNGNFTAADTVSDGASVSRGNQYSGTYTVNNDCTGTVIFKNSKGAVYANYDIVITNNAKSVSIIEADQGTEIMGTAQQQFPQ